MDSFYSTQELEKLGLKSYGHDVMISKKASIYGANQITLGNHVRIDDFCILSGAIQLGSYIHIAAYSALYGGKTGIIMEDFTGLSSRVVIYAESDDYSGNTLTNPMIEEKYRKLNTGQVVLKKHVIIGTGSTILPSVIVGEGASVGAMSLVLKNIEEWTINIGMPCRAVKKREKGLLALESLLLEENKNIET